MFGNQEQMRRMMSGDVIKPKSVGATLGRLASYFGRFWPVLLVVATLIIINTWAQVTAPDLVGQSVDCYLNPPGSNPFGNLGSFGNASSGEAIQSNCWLAS